jgi:hypothetical protein
MELESALAWVSWPPVTKSKPGVPFFVLGAQRSETTMLRLMLRVLMRLSMTASSSAVDS